LKGSVTDGIAPAYGDNTEMVMQFAILLLFLRKSVN
jgi:hypothetical protein